ncbi:MAG TPA: hypothetical protein VFQ91_20405 [Bryobacteraceae bacterium]|nr:hypothetical protein [Bryobacteraceae bacterium]
MSFRFAATATGPLGQILDALALPAALALTAREEHHVWSLVDPDQPPGRQTAIAAVPVATPVPDGYIPRLDSVDAWLPGMVVLMERRSDIRAAAAAEVSALWTSLAAPLKAAITGDIGLDLDLGIQARAEWQAASDCWWAIERPTAARALRLRLCAARNSALGIAVKATASAGLDQATRNAAAAALGRHRTQLLNRLRRGATDVVKRMPAPLEQIQPFLEQWLTLPAETQNSQWQNPVSPLLAALKSAVDGSVDAALAQSDQMAGRLEFAAVRTMEQKLQLSLAAVFDRRKTDTAILDALFDFDANPGLSARFTQALEGNLTPLLVEPVHGLTLYNCAITSDLTRRQTFLWQLPFSSGSLSARDRVQTAMQALDDSTGRIVRGYAKAESERRTRKAASLLSIEGAFATRLGGEVTVHTPAVSQARFTLDIRTDRPVSLEPLLALYGAGGVPPHASVCRLSVSVAPEAVSQWLLPQDSGEVSRRMQTAWRTLLVASVDMDMLSPMAAAPLLVWASLPVSTAICRTERGVELNRPGSPYWDWADGELRQAMVWNPRTRAALEARIEQSHFRMSADDMRRAVSQPVGSAVFRSLLQSEAVFVDLLTSNLKRYAIASATPAETLRNLSFLLAKLVQVFHDRLTSVYGPETARALGPLLLSAASPEPPTVEVAWE